MGAITEETINSERVMEMALEMTPQEQALLLGRLHENLESMELDAEHEAAWAAEVARRLREIDSGEAELIDHDVVMAEMRELIAR